MARRNQPHTATYKFKKVYVVLRDGTWFIDKFLDAKSNYIIFQNRTVKRGDIKVFNLKHNSYRPVRPSK